MTWYFILALEKLGMASNLRYISEERQAKMRWDHTQEAAV